MSGNSDRIDQHAIDAADSESELPPSSSAAVTPPPSYLPAPGLGETVPLGLRRSLSNPRLTIQTAEQHLLPAGLLSPPGDGSNSGRREVSARAML